MTDFYDDIYSDKTQEADSAAETENTEQAQESSYEWNGDKSYSKGEYHYSYINGNNSTAAHNPNNYDDAYSQAQPKQNDYQDYSGYASQQPQTNTYNEYSSAPNYGASQPVKPKKERKPRQPKSASRGFVAGALAVAIVASTAIGFGGGYLISNSQKGDTQSTSSGSLTINQVAKSDKTDSTGTAESNSTVAMTTSDIVKKTANSVVEIATEGIQTGSFARQYVTQGAGSGVIISEDGYIITNHHVIDGANKITVTMRDGNTTYDAQLIGSDQDNDIALLKIEATGLSPATFGNSNTLAVGDYVVAIGNPLGTLGGTVTDGIISALAREVTIEDTPMTLLQTNAQISPGNSGGGLFNAAGELVGIVNAKDSATEVEGIAFAIPINNVVNIIKDLKDYGYVTGKISTGMQFVDINSYDTAFYYNVNQLGVYVLSVDSGSNASNAGFRSGDLITKVSGKDVSTSADIDKALENNKVGDTVTFTVSRSGRTTDLKLVLSEYTPSAKPSNEDSKTYKEYRNNESLWDQLFNW